MHSIDLDIELHRADFRLALEMNIPSDGVTVLLGPSGGGKSTLLRAIAGLERPTKGHIFLGDKVWLDCNRRIDLPPQQRRAGLVFQHYALFPHLSAAGNVAFAARREKRAELTGHWLRALRIDDIADRRPAHLSGGQRQRVALARALAAEPPVLLLDEPFSAVDASLRRHLRGLFREVLTEHRRPTLLVTHDLDDARELGDRIGVLVAGELRRFGPAERVFEAPGDIEVARVLGWQNLLPITHVDARRAGGPWGELFLDRTPAPGCRWLGIRPHHLQLDAKGELVMRIERCTPLEGVTRVDGRLRDGTPLCLYQAPQAVRPQAGRHCRVGVAVDQVITLPEGLPANRKTPDVPLIYPGSLCAPSRYHIVGSE